MSKKIIMLIEDLYEDIEAVYPYYRLIEEGYKMEVVGPEKDKLYEGKHGMKIKSDNSSKKANLNGVTGLIIPGGYAPDRIVRDEKMVNLARQAIDKCAVVAAICHGPLVLVEADIIRGKKVTGFKSIKTVLKLAGAEVKDNRVVTDGNLITAQDAADVVEFTRAIITMLDFNKN